MANKTDKLIVSDISKTLFVIPFYQRGYRWTGKNVKQLLSDLYLFANNNNSDEEPEYCLQPIVLQTILPNGYSEVIIDEESVVRVVDGQQRLTTIAIILNKLGIKTTWDIYYDSEKKRLSEILERDFNLVSINDYFRKEVCEAVDEWFAVSRKKNENVDCKKILTDLFQTSKKRIAFLQYNIETSKENADKEGHDAFLRLNDGKTPLTSSELIRALYMVRSSGLSTQQQMEISKEWEIIENCLQNNQFWLMFNARGLEDTPTRIDLLFALVLGISLRETKANPRIVFEKLEDEDEQYDLEKVWDEVLHSFWWMQSCYSDVELFNYLGWIRAYTDISASTIYTLWRKHPVHGEFKDGIIKIIQDTNFGGVKLHSLDSVEYSWDKRELRKLFVLLNVLDCNKSKERFRFDLFNKCRGWDIEHIDSQTPNDFKQDKNKTEWLSDAWNELTKEQKNSFLQQFYPNESIKVEEFDVQSVELDKFNLYAEYIVQLTQDSEDKISDGKTNKLGNLALLNLSINRSYKNDIFPLKRKAIIAHINSGKEFIPPCTSKAFTKFYTKSASRITSWQNADYEGYFCVMNERFKSFMDYNVSVDDSADNNDTKSLRKEKSDIIEVVNTRSVIAEPTISSQGRFVVPISFTTFMDRYDVVVPKIQRLYVQGRLDKRGEKCLSGFANSLISSVTDSSPLLLDFVYGIDANGCSKSVFYPLDGQQRLTTLLLLSWLCGISKPEWSFRYESRRSTEVFIKGLLSSAPPQLLKPDNYEELKNKANKNNKVYPSLCKDYICNLPWFHESWLSDSGISGMIEMLDSLYDKLLNNTQQRELGMDSIVFLLNYLDVSRRSYDHIFLKMNSRGRELTEWDNVNAVLDEYLPESLKSVWPEKIQLWYELMWNKMPSTGSKDTEKINRVDAQMLSVVELALDCSGYNDKCTNTYELSTWLHNNSDVDSFYELCQIFFSALEINNAMSMPCLIPSWSLSKRPRIPNFVCHEKEVVRNFYQPLLAFYASNKSKDDKWMRVIWNLVENIGVERSSFKQAVHLIDKLSVGKDSILEYLCVFNNEDVYQKAKYQLKEEIDKAKQIINNSDNLCPNNWDESQFGKWKGWYDVIIAAESKRSFAGSIRFLYLNGQYNVDWSTFCAKWYNADLYFDSEGIKDNYASKLIAALLKRCSRWDQVHDNFIFNKKDWKTPVLLNRIYAEPLDYILQAKNLDVQVVDFEEGLICERIIRNRLFEDNLIEIITSKYQDYRISYGRYFYGWRKHDGILFDWRTDSKEPESWERRRNIQIHSILSLTPDFIVKNTIVSDELFFGYTLYISYLQTNLEWSDDNAIYLRENNHRKVLLNVMPNMTGEEILSKLQHEIYASQTKAVQV